MVEGVAMVTGFVVVGCGWCGLKGGCPVAVSGRCCGMGGCVQEGLEWSCMQR